MSLSRYRALSDTCLREAIEEATPANLASESGSWLVWQALTPALDDCNPIGRCQSRSRW
jgi:hypothetical protein